MANGLFDFGEVFSAERLPGGGLASLAGVDLPFPSVGGSRGDGPSDLFRSIASKHPILGGIFGGRDKPRKPYYERLANREWAQGNAVLQAFSRLYEPTLALAQRSASDYGALYRRAANEALAHQLLTQTSLRSGDLADFARLGPEYIETLRSTNPALAGLYDAVLEEFALGDQLSPSQRRNIAQSVRAGQAARGMGLGPSDVYEEAIQTSGYGDILRQQRLDNLRSSAGLYGDVFQATTGRPALFPVPQGANIQAPRVGTEWDDLFSYGVNREIQDRNISAAKSAANKALIGQIVGGLLGSASSIGSAYLSRG